MNAPRLLTGLLLALSASAAVGAGPACRPVLEAPWVRAAPPGATALAGYLVLRNGCRSPVEVVAVESLDFAMPMIHRSEVVQGVSRMRPAGKLAVAPGAELKFEPGGLHLMLMKPRRPMAEGDKARIRLVLADGRRLYAEFPLRREAP